MSGNRYLADTNAFIYLLSKHPALDPLLDSQWYYSFITEIELLGKPNITNSEIRIIQNLLTVATKINHQDLISENAIFIKRAYNLKTPDALIAGTAQLLGIPLITADKHFTRVEEIDIVLLELD